MTGTGTESKIVPPLCRKTERALGFVGDKSLSSKAAPAPANRTEILGLSLTRRSKAGRLVTASEWFRRIGSSVL
jgi:hypothetical protein